MYIIFTRLDGLGLKDSLFISKQSQASKHLPFFVYKFTEMPLSLYDPSILCDLVGKVFW